MNLRTDINQPPVSPASSPAPLVSRSTLAARTSPRRASRPTSSASRSTASASSSSPAAMARPRTVTLPPRTSRPPRALTTLSALPPLPCPSRTSLSSRRAPSATTRLPRTPSGSSVTPALRLASSVSGRSAPRPRLRRLTLRRNKLLAEVNVWFFTMAYDGTKVRITIRQWVFPAWASPAWAASWLGLSKMTACE